MTQTDRALIEPKPVSAEARIRRTARDIFGDDKASISRWVDYWRESRLRNSSLLDAFRPLAPLDFEGRRVLDIGCGTGGMGELIGPQGGFYVGGDVHHHILRLAPVDPDRRYLLCSGLGLPFASESFDFVFAFDVIEHLVGGAQWQSRFLGEVRRVLKPTGMMLLTTPNYWYPREGHTRLWGPQFLPLSWADRYISRRNPGFLKEHRTFGEIQLLKPSRFKRMLRHSGLAFLHELPCGLDRSDYRRHFPLRSILASLGLGWYPHAEFWGLCVRREMRGQLRLKLKKSWTYEDHQPSQAPARDFGSAIDFERDLFNSQLGPGWHWHERNSSRAFRWMRRSSLSYLQSRGPSPFLRLRGFSPSENRLQVFVDGYRVGERPLEAGEAFELIYLLPGETASDRLLEIEIRSDRLIDPRPDDHRELSVMIFSIALIGALEGPAQRA